MTYLGQPKLRLRPRTSDVWTQIPGEPEDAYLAFSSYRNQVPPRDIRRVHVHNVMVPVSTVSAWSRAWNWSTRTRVYDEHFDLIGVQERERVTVQEARRIGENHSRLLHQAFELCAREVNKLSGVSEAQHTPSMRPNELVRLLAHVVQLQRLAMGESTAKVDFVNKKSLDSLDVETLQQLDGILEKAGLNR